MPGYGTGRRRDNGKTAVAGRVARHCWSLLLLLTLAAPVSAQTANPESALAADGDGHDAASAASQPLILPDDDRDALLIQLVVGRQALEGVFPVPAIEDSFYIPLQTFAAALDLAISTDTSTGTARGFIITEARSFLLDAHRGEVSIAGHTTHFDPRRTAIRAMDDIYVELQLLQQWLPMDLRLSLPALQLIVSPTEPLPFQQQQARESRLKQLQARRNAISDRHLPVHRQDYRLIDYPFVDETVRFAATRADGHGRGEFFHATYAAMDLMYMESNLYLSGDDRDMLRDFRGIVRRRDPDGELGWFLGATEIAMGHVTEPRHDLINRLVSTEPGLFISNYPLHRQTRYDTHTFEGDLPPDWSVELYRNGVLLDYQTQAVQGRYRFDQVPLEFGYNHFRLVKYGPQGQVREEVVSLDLDQSLTRAGDHHYLAMVSRGEHNRARGVFQYDAGLSRSISANLSLLSLPLEYAGPGSLPWERHDYASVGLRSFFSSIFLRGDLIRDLEGGKAMDLGTRLRLGPLSLGAEQTWLDGVFVSEELPYVPAALRRQRQLQLDAPIRVPLLPNIRLNMEYRDWRFANRVDNSLSTGRLFLSGRGIAVTNSTTLQRVTGSEDAVTNSLQLSWRPRRFYLHGTLNWQLRPARHLDSAILSAGGIHVGRVVLGGGVSRTIMTHYDETWFSLSRFHGKFGMSFDARYGTGGVMRLGLTFNTGLGREPHNGQWHAEARPMATSGAASARVFLDNNLNGVMDAGDTGIDQVRLRMNGAMSPLKTGADGVVFLTGLEPWRPLDVQVASESLADPFQIPSGEGVRLLPRPGQAARLDFPVLPTGEIDGTVYIRQGASGRHAAGADVELVDRNGQVIMRTRSAHDGFYLFSQVPLGTYMVRVNPQQATRLLFDVLSPGPVRLTSQEPVASGMNIILER